MKKWLFPVIGLCIVVVIAIVAQLVIGRDSNYNNIYVYHFNPSTLMLEAESRPLPSDNILETALEYIYQRPQSVNLETTWPLQEAPYIEDLVKTVVIEEDILVAFFSPVFDDVPPLTRTLFKTAFVHTMESLVYSAFPEITDIKILVTDEYEYAFEVLMLNLSAEEDEYRPNVPWLIYDGSRGVFNDPFLSPARITPFVFERLYFVHESGRGLIVVTHSTESIDRRVDQKAMYALDLLIDGLRPENATFPIPQETTVTDIIIDGDVIFIDFNSDFESRFDGDTDLAIVMIYSIVNTMTSLFAGIHRVNFLIDTRQHEYFHGIEDFHMSFERDDTRLMSYILERDVRAAEEAFEAMQ